MNKFLTLLLILSQFSFSQVDVKNDLITKEDRKAEKKNEKERKKVRKEYEKAQNETWKKLDKQKRESSPWATWYRESVVKGLLQLSSVRKNLYKKNLYDTYVTRPTYEGSCDQYMTVRSIEGVCNDLDDPTMGRVWTRFGRNTDPKVDFKKQYDILYPNPRTISKELLERKEFKAVPFLNLMAVSWIQYMTHDWFSHGENEDPSKEKKPFYLPILDPQDAKEFGADRILIPRSMIDRNKSKDDMLVYRDTFRNEVTHWWDGSQLYGSTQNVANSLRSYKGGKLKVDTNGNIPMNKGVDITGFNRNWWVGLSMLHNLFTREHNAIADHLASKYPEMTDEDLYQKARLITAALMAKIHTVEWTPAILPSSHLQHGMMANWSGLVNTLTGSANKVKKGYEVLPNEVLFGIVGGKKNLADVPFAMTEEFVSVYRMHPLLPDTLNFKKMNNPSYNSTLSLHDTRESKSGKLVNKYNMADLFYSFGQMHPGQLTLHNYPKTLMNIDIPFVAKMDLAALDIIRDRERGVPRYNEFRRRLQLKEIKKFEDLTSDKEIVAKLKKIYDNDVEALDLLVGSLAEEYRPNGFGFGETSFQVFIAMASRRLVADRFYTKDYNKKTYTKEGIKWVDQNNMKTILLRHFPELGKNKVIFGVKNVFNPWLKADTNRK